MDTQLLLLITIKGVMYTALGVISPTFRYVMRKASWLPVVGDTILTLAIMPVYNQTSKIELLIPLYLASVLPLIVISIREWAKHGLQKESERLSLELKRRYERSARDTSESAKEKMAFGSGGGSD